MDIHDKLREISRRRFLQAAAGGAAAVVAVPAAVRIADRGHEVAMEQRIRKFLDDQLALSVAFAWNNAKPSRAPEKQPTNTVRYSPINDKHEFDNVRLCDTPEVAFASATDPKFEELKQMSVVGPMHKSPREWMPNAKTVISFFYPFTEEIRASNRPEGVPSKLWVAAKASSEIILLSAAQALVNFLAGHGAEALIPAVDPRFHMTQVGGITRPAWAERHVGYVAGLGTFGLSGLLITRKGAAGRICSVITSLELEPTHRPYKDKNAYCLYYMQGSCRLCSDRCPPKAIHANGGSPAGVCSKYAQEVVALSVAPLPYKGGCGKCATAVPCETSIPRGIVAET